MIQFGLSFPPESGSDSLEVLDLFAGIGGMSLGFQQAGFSVTGVDIEAASARVFHLNRIGGHVVRDLRNNDEERPVSVIVGGPPCRPWSSVNLQRRGEAHEDHALLQRFFDHLLGIRPRALLMENVPPLSGDRRYQRLLRDIEFAGYSVSAKVLRYSDFGAATSRRRLFTFGIRDSVRWSAQDFFVRLEGEHATARTVRDAIGWLSGSAHENDPDHQWSRLKTIAKYRERYESGKYGWKKLDWDSPAPSFGSVAKTYILHPDPDAATGEPRVLSVREVLSIMGFAPDFAFPKGTALSLRYRMAANAVSPIVAAACARTIKAMLAEPNSVQTSTPNDSCWPKR